MKYLVILLLFISCTTQDTIKSEKEGQELYGTWVAVSGPSFEGTVTFHPDQTYIVTTNQGFIMGSFNVRSGIIEIESAFSKEGELLADYIDDCEYTSYDSSIWINNFPGYKNRQIILSKNPQK